MIRFAVHLFLFTTVLFLSACEFNPSDIPMSDIKKPVSGEPMEIRLTPDMDTLRIAYPVWVIYSVNAGDHKIYDIKIQFDTSILKIEGYTDIRTYLDLTDVSDGMHDLNVNVYTSTNSGSIADKLDAEAFLYEKHWPVYINKKGRENLRFNPPVILPAGLKLSWQQYRYVDFESYTISWSSFFGSGTKKIYDPRHTYFIDTTLIEGCFAQYSLEYNLNNGTFVDYQYYAHKIIDPVVKINPDCSIDISWTHSLHEQKVKLYCLKTTAPNFGMTEEHDITDLHDTTLKLTSKIGFGGNYSIGLKYIPVNFNSYHSVLETQGGVAFFALGDQIPEYDKVFNISSENRFLMYKAGKFFKYNPQNGEKSNELAAESGSSTDIATIASSPDGNYFGYFTNEKYVIRRTSDFSTVNIIDIQGYDNHNLELNDVNISNNGIVSTADYNNYIRLFDAATGTKIFQQLFDSDCWTRKAIISHDGKNLAVMVNNYTTGDTELRYFSFSGTQLNEIGRVTGVGKDYSASIAYSPESQHKIVIPRWISTYHYVIEVRDSRNFTLLLSSDVGESFIPVAYDFSSDMAIAQYQFFPTKDYSFLINLNTHMTDKIIQLNEISNYKFNAGRLYSGNGRSIEINNYIIK
jgi:hypothetical protein